ncbi:glycosyltransferase family 87 protein [Nocardioides yefusunii]|uniref:Glycosyltransferase family 87 protein n=1 Tax=Nocardioides yefusunii TaxID=2500546 RepID=A0ABW1R2U9_9ACTN|nr:glycosyltransferase 87 family protein [Nocardioides yefusunii]
MTSEPNNDNPVGAVPDRDGPHGRLPVATVPAVGGTTPDDGGTVRPTLDDPFVASLSAVLGGPAGAHVGGAPRDPAARRRWWAPVQVLVLLTAVVFALGMLTKAPCAVDDWQDDTVRYTHGCYSDMPYLYSWRGLSDLAWPYSQDPAVRAEFEVMEYPAGISYWAWATGYVTWLVSGAPDVDDPERDLVAESTTYVAVNAVGIAVIAMLTTWLLAGVHRRRPWDAAGWALAPTMALTALVNWDLLAVVTVAGAAWAWSRGHPRLTGVMIGVGTAIKLYPLLLLGAVLVLCLRHWRWRTFLLTLASAVVSWILVNAPAFLTGPAEWKHFFTFNSERGADLGSIWLVLRDWRWPDLSVETVNAASWVFLLLWCLGVLLVGLRAPVTPRFAQLAFLVVAGFLIVNKVYSPQYVLWLLPLAVLAHPRWRDLVLWQLGELVYLVAVWWYLGGLLAPTSGGAWLYWLAIGVRIAAQLWFVAVVVRAVLDPDEDVVGEERGGLHGRPEVGQPA